MTEEVKTDKILVSSGLLYSNNQTILPKHVFADTCTLLQELLKNIDLDIKVVSKYHRLGNKHIQLIGLEVPKSLIKETTSEEVKSNT